MGFQRRTAMRAGVLMVRPARFGYNVETAASNRFQRDLNPLTSPLAPR